MNLTPVVSSTFRALACGPWDPETLGCVKIDLWKFPEGRLRIRVKRMGTPLVVFDVDGYTYKEGLLRLRVGSTDQRWLFRVID